MKREREKALEREGGGAGEGVKGDGASREEWRRERGTGVGRGEGTSGDQAEGRTSASSLQTCAAVCALIVTKSERRFTSIQVQIVGPCPSVLYLESLLLDRIFVL